MNVGRTRRSVLLPKDTCNAAPTKVSRLCLGLFILVLFSLHSWIFFILHSDEPDPEPILQSCHINLVHLMKNATKGSKPIVLFSFLQGLLWASEQGLLTFVENAPISEWNSFDLTLILNFACASEEYKDDDLDFSAVLVPSIFEEKYPVLKEHPLNYSNIGMWTFAWDQVSEWGCKGQYFYETMVRHHEAVMLETMRKTLLAGEVSHHYRLLRKRTDQRPILLPTLVPLDTFPSLEHLQAQRVPEFRGILYIKHPAERHLPVIPSLRQLLHERHIPFDEFVYGSYAEANFSSSLEKASIAIVVDDLENFGNAIQKVKGYDVPIFTISNALEKGWFSSDCGVFVSCAQQLSFEELDRRFARFLEQVRDGAFTPRQWIAKHLTAGQIFPNLAASLCQRRSPIFAGHETEAGVAFVESC